MAGFHFKSLNREWPSKMTNSNWLWIWNADKIPPHIGISIQKDYFSLTYKMAEFKQTLSMIKKAKRSAIPLLLVQIDDAFIQADATTSFQQYSKAKVGGPTCLTPIKQLLGEGEQVNQLAELLLSIEKRQNGLNVFALHLKEDYKQLPNYTVEEIMKRIGELNDPKR